MLQLLAVVNKNGGNPVGLNLGHTKYSISGSDEQISPEELRQLEKIGLVACYETRDEWWSVSSSGQTKMGFNEAGTSTSTPMDGIIEGLMGGGGVRPESKETPQQQAVDDEVYDYLAMKVLKAQSDLILTTQKLSNDQQYIHRLHEYNYLKDATFTLCEILANINKTSALEVFKAFDIRDTETCFILTGDAKKEQDEKLKEVVVEEKEKEEASYVKHEMNRKQVDVKKLYDDKKAIEDAIAEELQEAQSKKTEADRQIAEAVKAIEEQKIADALARYEKERPRLLKTDVDIGSILAEKKMAEDRISDLQRAIDEKKLTDEIKRLEDREIRKK